MKKIYCKEINRQSSVKKYLEEYLGKYCPATYNEDGTLQCEADKSRSLKELYNLVKTEYSSIRLTKFLKDLNEVSLKLNRRILICIFLKDITCHRHKMSFPGKTIKGTAIPRTHWDYDRNFKSSLGLTLSEIHKIITND